MTFTTPFIAFAPHTAEAGPRMISICLISLVLTGMRSQRTKPKKSWYTERPSITARCESERVPVAARVFRLKSRAAV